MSAYLILPKLPYEGFPLRPHRNKHWYRSVWNPRTKKSEQFYFGSWVDDPKGQRALTDPQFGWLARREAIKAGVDNVRVQAAGSDVSLGELMARFLAFKRDKVASGELSLATLDGYLKEIPAFVTFQKPGTPAGGLKPEHFSAYMKHLVEKRKLGRFARKRVITYVNTYLRYGAKNGWISMPNTGTDWVAPATDPDSMRVARARAGIKDYSDRLVTGEEIDMLLQRSQPAFKALILLGVNAGIGPADLGRLRWNMIDLDKRQLNFPRGKTGVGRVGYLWKKTVVALRRVRKLKHNLQALEREGEAALVFLTRRGQACYRETPMHLDVPVDGQKVKKLVGVRIDNPIVRTFGRMVRELKLSGISFYRLRHSFRTYGQRARDREALDACMGHKGPGGVGRVYDHEQMEWSRIKRVAKVVYRQLWPKIKRKEETRQVGAVMKIASDNGDVSLAA